VVSSGPGTFVKRFLIANCGDARPNWLLTTDSAD
jgi:hypothetical protein